MRIRKNADFSILNDMDGILSSEEYISLFSPIKKKAQYNPATKSPLQYEPAEMTDETGANVYAPDVPEESYEKQVSVEDVKKVLNNILSDASFADPSTKAAASSVAYQGRVSEAEVQALSRFFPGVSLDKLKEAFDAFVRQPKQASVSNVIPVVVKIANTLSNMGFELSELAADRLLQTITVEAKSKIKAKKDEDEKKGNKKVDKKVDKKDLKAPSPPKKVDQKELKESKKNCPPKKY